MSLPEHDSPEMVQRREILRRVAWLMGGAVSAPAALAILQGCGPAKSPNLEVKYIPRFMSEGRMFEVVTAIADIIIPHTDSSGALDVGVPSFIDQMLADVYDEKARARFTKGFAEFESSASMSGKPFLDRDSADRTAFVKESLERALAQVNDGKPFILMTRELTLLGFYTSQVGISENMEYVAVPTVFHGCVPLSSLSKPVYWE
jgi:gluconate 2-dehydrogenase gamma chain